jgi:hypothetical protein
VVQKFLLLLPLKFYISFLGKKINYFLNKIKGSAYYGCKYGNACNQFAQRMWNFNPTVGVAVLSQILKNMKNIKNYFDYAIWSEAGLTDFQLFTLLQEGGMV